MTTTAARWTRQRLSIGAVVAVSALIYGWGITGEGWGNLYYSASVRSMNRSWSGFFFGTFDPARLITTDKPPLALWIEVGFARLFGYHGWALLAPQVIEGAATVWLLYLAVHRWAGYQAAITAAVVLTVTPIVVAINRDTNPDTLLMLLLVGAAYTTTRALDSDHIGWLVATAALVGAATLTKSLTGWLILPAMALAYLTCGPNRPTRRMARLAVAGVIIVVATLAWPAAVDLTPASHRPYVEGSNHNSELELTFVTNGVDRFLGVSRPARAKHETASGTIGAAPPSLVGHRSPWRLLIVPFGGQIGWLLPLAALAAGSGLWVAWRRRRPRLELAGWLFWGGWLGTTSLVISMGGGVSHVYYANEIAPALAATTGAGLVLWARAWRARQPMGWFLPGAIAVSTLLGVDLARHPVGDLARLAPAIGLAGVVAIGALAMGRYAAGDGSAERVWWRIAIGAGAVALLAGPIMWSWQPLRRPPDPVDPRAGPSVQTVNTGAVVDSLGPALRWIDARPSGSRYQLALGTVSEATGWVVAGDRSVIGLGGYFGGEPLPPSARLASMIRHGQIHYALISPTLFSPTTQVIRSLCRRVPGHPMPLDSADLLYGC